MRRRKAFILALFVLGGCSLGAQSPIGSCDAARTDIFHQDHGLMCEAGLRWNLKERPPHVRHTAPRPPQ